MGFIVQAPELQHQVGEGGGQSSILVALNCPTLFREEGEAQPLILTRQHLRKIFFYILS
jgi:hypothetical protein